MANGTQLASDNFTRANENPLSGGGNWTTISGMSALKLLNNAVEATITGANCGALYTGLTWAADQYSEITLGTHPPSNADAVPIVRSDASRANCYMVLFTNTTGTLYKVVATAATQIGQVTGLTVANGDVLRLTAIGAAIIVSQNQKIVLSIFDTAVVSGTPGILIFDTTAITDTTFTSWAGGSPSGNSDGIWTKQGVVMPALTSDITTITGIKGTSNQTMLYEGNAQLLSGNVFKMWFQGNGSIYYAESTDGLTWTRQAAAVIANVGIPRIFKSGSTYYLYVNHLHAFTQIDQYTSSDGVTWSLGQANVLGLGAGGSWDSTNIFYFTVIGIFAGTWKALYGGYNGTTSGTGLATSPDGVTWTKYAGNPVITNARWINAFDGLYPVGGVYYGWPTQGVLGQTNGTQGLIARLQSADFITWTSEVPSIQSDTVFEGVNSALGQTAVASVLQMGNKTYMFYTATTSDAANVGDQIYLATSPYTIPQLVKNPEYFAPYVQTATDNFTRANGAIGANWTAPTGYGTPQIASNKAEPAATGASSVGAYTASSFDNDQYSEVTIATLNTAAQIYLMVRSSLVAKTSYLALLGPGTPTISTTLQIIKAIAGATTNLGPTTSWTPNVGDVMRIAVKGNVISVFQNGFLLLEATDYASSIASGSPGFQLFATNTVTDSQISNWAGGNADASLPPSGGGSSSWLTVANANALRGLKH